MRAARQAQGGICIAFIIVLAAMAVCPFYRVAWAQAPSNLPKAQEVIGFLNQSIDWHRQLALETQVAGDPSDLLFAGDNRQTAMQVLRLSFDFARADAQLAATQDADAEVRQTQSELDADRAKLPTVRGSERQRLQAEIDELQSELDLAE